LTAVARLRRLWAATAATVGARGAGGGTQPVRAVGTSWHRCGAGGL